MANEIIVLYNDFVAKVEELELPNSLEDPPLLNVSVILGKFLHDRTWAILQGNEVSLLLSKKPGPWTGIVLNQIIKWQLDHPRGAKDECATWLKEEINSGRMTLHNNPKNGQDREVVYEPLSKKVKLSKGV